MAHPPGPIALCIMYRPPADPNKVGVYVVYSVCLVTCTCTPSDAHRPPPTSIHGGAEFRAYMCHYNVCTYLFTPAPPLLLPIHPIHPVTSSHTPHLSRRFASWPLTPPPRSDSVRSTVHNVQTPCRPLRTQQGGRVRGLQCLSCHMHTIRRPPAPVGPSHLHTRWCGVSCIMCAIIMCVHIRSLLPLPLLLPAGPNSC